MRVLLVEDNLALAKWIAKALRQSEMIVDCLHDGAAAHHVLLTQSYNIVLLDLSLPRMEGLAILRNLRARKSPVPVIILTVKNRVEDRVEGLDAGADDYLAKPFALSELEARIRACARRAQGTANNKLSLGLLSYDSHGGLFRLADHPLELTPRERAVLEQLILHANAPVSKQLLSDQIVGLDAVVSIEAIETYIHRLRKKLDGCGVEIQTLRGLGYLLKANDA